jgi:hypothetical protein
MSENNSTKTAKQSPNPNSDLKYFEKLIGTWKLSGAIQGTNTFEWMEGGFFLVQHYEFEQEGRRNKGMEIIGHEQPMGAEPGAEIKSRIYGFLDGLTQDYVYEINDNDAFTIWMGEKSSPTYCKVKFSDDGNTIDLEWIFPGGSYKVTAVKAK